MVLQDLPLAVSHFSGQKVNSQWPSRNHLCRKKLCGSVVNSLAPAAHFLGLRLHRSRGCNLRSLSLTAAGISYQPQSGTGVGNCDTWAKSDPPPVLIKYIVLELATPVPLRILGCSRAMMKTETTWLAKPKIFIIKPFKKVCSLLV